MTEAMYEDSKWNHLGEKLIGSVWEHPSLNYEFLVESFDIEISASGHRRLRLHGSGGKAGDETHTMYMLVSSNYEGAKNGTLPGGWTLEA